MNLMVSLSHLASHQAFQPAIGDRTILHGGRVEMLNHRQQKSPKGSPSLRCLTLLILGLVITASEPLWAQGGWGKQGGPLDGLYLLQESKTSRISSYDHTGGNSDWITIAPSETKTLF